MSMAQKQALRLPHLAVIVGIGLFLTIPLLISNTPSGHDFFFHVMLPPFAKSGIFPHTSRISPDAPSPAPRVPFSECRECVPAGNSA